MAITMGCLFEDGGSESPLVLSILNPLMVITFLAGIVLVIFLRTVRRDLTRYEELDKEAQAQMNEELSGWKLVVGDVFRAPNNASLLCIMVGDGVQILGMDIVCSSWIHVTGFTWNTYYRNAFYLYDTWYCSWLCRCSSLEDYWLW